MITKRRKRKFNTTFFFSKKWASYNLYRKFRYIRWIVSPLCASKVKRSQNFYFLIKKRKSWHRHFRYLREKNALDPVEYYFIIQYFHEKLYMHASCKFVMFHITQLQKLYKNTCMVIHKTVEIWNIPNSDQFFFSFKIFNLLKCFHYDANNLKKASHNLLEFYWHNIVSTMLNFYSII